MTHFHENNDDYTGASDWLDDDEDDENDVVICGFCGAEVYEDSPKCPSCGQWITADTSPWSGRATWWIILGILGIIAVVLTLSGAF